MKISITAIKIPLSFFLTALLPIILIGGFIYVNNRNTASKNAEEAIANRLAHVVDVLRYEYDDLIEALMMNDETNSTVVEIAPDHEAYLENVEGEPLFDTYGFYYSPYFTFEQGVYQIVIENGNEQNHVLMINLSDLIRKVSEKTEHNLEVFSPSYVLLYNRLNPEKTGKRILNDLTNLMLEGEAKHFYFEGNLNQFTVCFLGERELFVNLSTPTGAVLADYKQTLLFVVFATGLSLIIAGYFAWKSLKWQDEYASSKQFSDKVNRGLIINREIRRLLDETLDDVEPLSQITAYLNRLEKDLKRIRDEMDQ